MIVYSFVTAVLHKIIESLFVYIVSPIIPRVNRNYIVFLSLYSQIITVLILRRFRHMKLIFDALGIYCLGVCSDFCMGLFNFRVKKLLERNEALTDKLTIRMSNICWHLRMKLRIAEAEFEVKRMELLNSSAQ